VDISELQNTLLNIYHKNIEYLKLNNTFIYNKIKTFESRNIENWYIDFIDNRFELSNIDGTKVYNCNPFFDANYRANNINNNPSFTLINSLGYHKGVSKYEDSINAYEFINEFIQSPNDYQPSNLKQKFIFIGTLLGVHINDIHRIKNAKAYLIIEPNIEIFRLSLFLCDYTEVSASSKIFFCIDFDDFEFNTTIKEFLDYKYEYNHIIPFELASNNEAYLIEKLNIQLLDNSEMIYPFSEYIISLKRGYRYFTESKNKILDISPNKKYLQNLPILFLGAGPSLPPNLEWIYMNQDNFFIIAASATLKRLEVLGIIPDIILIVDGAKERMLAQFEVSSKMFINSIVLASINIDYDLFKILDSNKLFFIQNSLELFNGYGISTGLTVGDSGLDLILRFGAKEVYMLGIDASLRSDGKTHDGLHTNSKNLDITKNTANKGIDYDSHIIWVKGNSVDKVPTTMLYYGMIEHIEAILSKSESHVYNLSNGAFFRGSISCKIDDKRFDSISSINKNDLSFDILNSFKQNSKNTLSKQDISELTKEKKVLKKLESLNNKDFYKEFTKIKSNFRNSICIQIINKYLKVITPYAEYFDNTHILAKQIKLIIKELDLIISYLLSTKS